MQLLSQKPKRDDVPPSGGGMSPVSLKKKHLPFLKALSASGILNCFQRKWLFSLQPNFPQYKWNLSIREKPHEYEVVSPWTRSTIRASSIITTSKSIY